jgi:hypothetical protein
MGRRLDAFLEAVGRLSAAEQDYVERQAPIVAHKVALRAAARDLHDAMLDIDVKGAHDEGDERGRP